MRKLFAVLLTMLMVLSMAMTAMADGNVTYDGDARSFIFEPGSEYSPSDLFTDFKGVMPGDNITQQVVIKNDASKDVDVKIYMRSLGWQLDSEEFLSEMTLTVEQVGKSVLFEAAADQEAQLTDWVCLGTFKSGAEVTLDVTLNVPITMDNEFQEEIGYLDWQFMVEEFPIEPDIPLVPDTGDDSNVMLWVFLMLIAVGMLVTAVEVVKKRKAE